MALDLSQLFPGCLLSRFFLTEEERHSESWPLSDTLYVHSLPQPQSLKTETCSLAGVPPADLSALISKEGEFAQQGYLRPDFPQGQVSWKVQYCLAFSLPTTDGLTTHDIVTLLALQLCNLDSCFIVPVSRDGPTGNL